MTNDTIRAMPTVEEIEAMAKRLCTSHEDARALGGLAANMLRIIADQMRKSEPVAYATHHEPPMVFTEIDEAWCYCGDDEPPLPLYTTPLADTEDARRYRWLIQQSDKADSIIQHHDPKMWNNLIDSAMKEDSHDYPTD